MKILILLSLFLSTFVGSYIINDIIFNENYPVTQHGSFIWAPATIYLRMPILKDDKMEVCLTTHTGYYSYFKVYVSFFPRKPVDYEIVSYKYDSDLSYDGTTVVDDYYTTYNYPFDTPSDSSYLGIRIDVLTSLDYLDVMVISAAGLVWAFIVGGVVLFIALVVGGIFGYRKYRR